MGRKMKEKQIDVTALGELLIDFTQNGMSSQGNYLMEANPGGAPCNVLSMLQKLGKKTAFIGKVGDDFLGHFLGNVVAEAGINTDSLFFDKEIPTTLAFVHNDENGDREFSFYRKPGADICLKEEEVNEEQIKNSRLFHFGSLSMTHEEVRKATKKAIACAKENGLLISFDPNLRESLWNSLLEAQECISYGMKQCDILKISDNEILWFTGKDNFDEGIRFLQETYQIPLILLSMGKDGSRAYTLGGEMAEAKGFLQESTIETTGAGDTFCACCLNFVLEHGLKELNSENMKEMLVTANAAASIITTKKGALRVMPERAEIEALIKERA